MYLETPYGDIGIALKGWKRWILSLIALLVNKNIRTCGSDERNIRRQEQAIYLSYEK